MLQKLQQIKSTLVGVINFQSHRKIRMNVNSESRKEINDRGMEVLSAKTETRIGF